MQDKREYLRRYYQENKERLSKANKQYYLKNREELYRKNRLYILKNIEAVREYKHRWYLKNIDKCKMNARNSESRNRVQVRLNHSNWKKNNRAKANLQMRRVYKKRYKNDINYRLRIILRSRLRSAMKSRRKIGSSVEGLGCTIDELKLHIEKQFKDGMSWDNWGLNGWHIDHIIPISSFDLTNREQFLKACHFTNLQPLWAKDNLIKNNKVNGV